jgi:hypothetical protein
MAAVGLEGSDEGQIELLAAIQKLGQGQRQVQEREPGSPALFDGFDGRGAPMGELMFALSLIEMHDHARGEQGHDAVHAQFDRSMQD